MGSNSHMISELVGSPKKYIEVLVPLLSPFNYSEWKPKMCAYINRKCLYDVSIGVVRELESYEEKCDWLKDCDRAYGTICLAIPPRMRY